MARCHMSLWCCTGVLLFLPSWLSGSTLPAGWSLHLLGSRWRIRSELSSLACGRSTRVLTRIWGGPPAHVSTSRIDGGKSTLSDACKRECAVCRRPWLQLCESLVLPDGSEPIPLNEGLWFYTQPAVPPHGQGVLWNSSDASVGSWHAHQGRFTMHEDQHPAGPLSLAGLGALVTGAAGGIGRAIADRLFGLGARVYGHEPEPADCGSLGSAVWDFSHGPS